MVHTTLFPDGASKGIRANNKKHEVTSRGGQGPSLASGPLLMFPDTHRSDFKPVPHFHCTIFAFIFLFGSCVLHCLDYLLSKRAIRDIVKEKFISEIDALTWSSICGGPLPYFPRTPMLQRGRQPKSATASLSTPSAQPHSPSLESKEVLFFIHTIHCLMLNLRY